MLEHKGRLTDNGESRGHYLCDIKLQESDVWVRTNDNTQPKILSTSDVSKFGYVILMHKI